MTTLVSDETLGKVVVVKIWRARAAILQEERDAARTELAATKKKLQGIMYGGKRRRK